MNYLLLCRKLDQKKKEKLKTSKQISYFPIKKDRKNHKKLSFLNFLLFFFVGEGNKECKKQTNMCIIFLNLANKLTV